MPTLDNFSFLTYSFLLVVQTGAFFYWAGTISRAVKEHDRRLNRIENNKKGD